MKKDEMFNELMASMREAVAIHSGELQPAAGENAKPTLEDILAQMPDVNPYDEIDWGKAEGKEIW